MPDLRHGWRDSLALSPNGWLLFFVMVFGLCSSLRLEAAGYRSDRILVQFKKDVTAHARARLHAQAQAKMLGEFGIVDGLEVIAVPEGKSVPQLVEFYSRSGIVDSAEPDYVRQLASTPNDPRFLDGSLWWFNNVGQNGGRIDSDIDAPEAWETLTSAPDVVVAVLDSGIRYTHEDLSANMWINPQDGSHGWNALTGTNDPGDSSGHGTLSAGVLGAVGNNGKGTVGVAWQVQLMACTCFDAAGNGSDSAIIACLDFARTNGARIVNASWGSYSSSVALSNAIYQLRQAGIILVAAAGNDGRDIDAAPYFPASYDIDNIVSVAYTTGTDELGRLSNFGATNVDLAAPGAAMFSTFFAADNSYLGSQFLEGTSFSAPLVSGALALLTSLHPSENHVRRISRLLAAVDPLASLAGKCSTGGRLSLARTLNPRVTLMVRQNESGMSLRVHAEPGREVTIEACTIPGEWLPVHTNITSIAGTFEYSEPLTHGASARFFRAFWRP